MSYTFTPGDKHVIVEPTDSELTATIIQTLFNGYKKDYNSENVVLVLSAVKSISKESVDELELFFLYVKGNEKSFVIASLDDDLGYLLPNIEQTPSISEAQDLIFMEEVERELGAHLDFEED